MPEQSSRISYKGVNGPRTNRSKAKSGFTDSWVPGFLNSDLSLLALASKQQRTDWAAVVALWENSGFSFQLSSQFTSLWTNEPMSHSPNPLTKMNKSLAWDKREKYISPPFFKTVDISLSCTSMKLIFLPFQTGVILTVSINNTHCSQ